MDARQNNFEVIVDGAKCKLTGHLVDSTNLNLYKEIFLKTDEISMAELYSISWLGVQRFYELLENMDKNVFLTEIPPHIYRTILLLLKPEDKVAVKSLVVEVLDAPQQKRKITTRMEKLVTLGTQQGAFAVWSDGAKISGSLHHLCRPHFGDKAFPPMNFTSTWCKENKEICSFFYEYACFMRVILEVCALAQKSTSTLIEESLQQICTRIGNLEFGIKSLDPHFAESKSRILMPLLPHI